MSNYGNTATTNELLRISGFDIVIGAYTYTLPSATGTIALQATSGIYGSSNNIGADRTVTLSDGVTTDHNLTFASITEPNLLHLDATNDRVGIGILAPTEQLHIVGNALINGEEKLTGDLKFISTAALEADVIKIVQSPAVGVAASNITFDGTTGGLFAITDDKDGQLFGVADVSGNDIMYADADWLIRMGNPFQTGGVPLELSYNDITGDTTLKTKTIDVNLNSYIVTSTGVTANIDVTKSIIKVTSTTSADLLSLPNGVDGQKITITYAAEAAAADTVTITPTNLLGYTTISLNDLGDSVELIYDVNTTTWIILNVFNAVIFPIDNKIFHTLTEFGPSLVYQWDYSLGYNAQITMVSDRLLAEPINTSDGDYGTLVITQDAVGGWTLGLPASFKVVNSGAGAITLSTDPGAIDSISWVKHGSNFLVTVGVNFN